MRRQPIKFISKSHEILMFKWLLAAIIIIVFTCPAFARKDKTNFSPSSGKKYEQESEDLDVPYVPTPMKVVRTLLNLASVGPKDFLIDLGSGDGRIVITAAKEYGVQGFGVDLNEKLVELSKNYAVEEGVAKQTEFFVQDIFNTDIRNASIVTMYLLNEVNLELRPKLLNELKAGTRIISHDFHMGAWRPDKMTRLDLEKYYQKDTLLYLWVVPAKVAGRWQWTLPLGGKDQHFDLSLNQNFQDISGTVHDKEDRLSIFNPLLEGDRIRFSLVSEADERMIRQDYSGRVKGNIIKGTVQLGGTVRNKTLEWQAVRVRQ